jgi:uncharacterized protein YbcV (DUF1398 family)
MKKLKVISMGRVGTVAINRFLDDHPQITLPHYKLTNQVFNNPKANFDMMPFESSKKLKVKGIVIHDGKYLENKNKKTLNNIKNQRVEKLIHLVRNPKQQVISWINYINSCALAGVGKWVAVDNSVKSFYDLYQKHFDTMLVGTQMDLFYDKLNKNEDVKLIDFEELSPQKVNDTMSDLYHYLEVDDYQCRFSQEMQNNLTISLLNEGFKFLLNKEVIHLVFAPLSFYYEANGHDNKPFLIINKQQEVFNYCPSLPPLNESFVVMPKSVQEFNKLSLKTRKMFHQDIKNIISQIMPAWAKSSEKVAQKIEIQKLHTLSDSDHDFLAQRLKPDLEKFYGVYPEFRNKWDIY